MTGISSQFGFQNKPGFGLQNLFRQQSEQIQKLQSQLASGIRLQQASDGPADLVIAERLRSQISATDQAISNSQRASSVVNTAEAGLSEASRLLTEARGLTVQAADGTLSDEERDALQTRLDGVLSSIDRIANTTRFGSLNLLDGSQGFRTDNASSGLSNIDIQSGVVTGDSRNVSVEVTQVAERADAGVVSGQTGDVSIQVSGELGTATVSIAAGSSASDVADAINAFSDQTGVEVDSDTGTLQSQEFGSDAFVRIEEVSGTLDAFSTGNFNGTDIEGRVDGVSASGNRDTLRFNNSNLSGELQVDASAGTGSFSFDVSGNGFRTSLSPDGSTEPGLGISSVHTGLIGLSELRSGGSLDLNTNPQGAAAAIENAQTSINGLRGRLGAFVSNTAESRANALEESRLSLAGAESQIRDTDFARSIAELTAVQIRQQATIAAQVQGRNLLADGILGLLIR